MAETLAIKYSCGPAPLPAGYAPVFNDLASTRNDGLQARTGLCRAIELIRYLAGGSAATVYRLEIENPDDLAEEGDRSVVAALLETVDAALVIGGVHVASYDYDDTELVDLLNAWSQPDPPASLVDGREDESCHYLRNELGLTANGAAHVLNAALGEQRFTEKRVLYYASKKTPKAVDILVNALRAAPPGPLDGEQLCAMGAAHVLLSAGSEVLSDSWPTMHRFALACYQAAARGEALPQMQNRGGFAPGSVI